MSEQPSKSLGSQIAIVPKVWYNEGIEKLSQSRCFPTYWLSEKRTLRAMSNDTTPTKTCTRCGQEFPATLEYFYKNKDGKYGLRSRCIACYQEVNRPRAREWHRTNNEYSKEQSRKWREENLEYDKERKRLWYQENIDHIKEQSKKWREENHEYNKERSLQWYYDNIARARENARQYSKANRPRLRIKQREYRKNNPQLYKRTTQQYYQNNKSVFRAQKLRRRAKERSLPSDFTAEQLEACLEYFHYCCAVCGKQLRDLFGDVIPHIDHWIPMANPDCPGTVVENMVCLCNGCNLTKSAKHPDEWLSQEFGKRKAKKILSEIEAYFEWAIKRKYGESP